MNPAFENQVTQALREWNWKCDVEEGMLKLLELMVKRQNGCYNSYTETGFLDSMGVMTKANIPNKKGKRFMMYMLSACSNRRPPVYEIIKRNRT